MCTSNWLKWGSGGFSCFAFHALSITSGFQAILQSSVAAHRARELADCFRGCIAEGAWRRPSVPENWSGFFQLYQLVEITDNVSPPQLCLTAKNIHGCEMFLVNEKGSWKCLCWLLSSSDRRCSQVHHLLGSSSRLFVLWPTKPKALRLHLSSKLSLSGRRGDGILASRRSVLHPRG